MPTVTCICRQRGHTTSGDSLFEAAKNALHWWEVSQKDFGTAFSPNDDEIITVSVVAGETYRVKVGRVREWTAQQLAARDNSG